MATKSENADIAVLQTQMTDQSGIIQEVRGDIKEIKGLMAGWDNHYVTRVEFLVFKRQYWLSHSLTAVLAAITVSAAYWIIGGVHPK